ncbi:hypothetical protein [Sporosarcina sp. Te-1]|uniref:hypothetical protein n=1 Tax=Sporosarcina sp. Te-1 TaxID=2818390 RepID=UPI001A9DC84B|nr:hypothetical protein [Sporosarcina sp. Te-1]QTD39455.1 hypothetical protein J3U78_11265 [Sporosarcina sp. Te-1]
MRRRRIFIAGAAVAVVLLLTAGYLLFIAKPAPFPSDEQALIDELNTHSIGAAIEQVLDVFPVEERFQFVPFVTDEKDYGMSFWVWKDLRWQPAFITYSGEPRVWKVREGDPSTYRIVWNISPESSLSTLNC